MSTTLQDEARLHAQAIREVMQHYRTDATVPSNQLWLEHTARLMERLADALGPPSAAPEISQSVLDGVTVAGARAFWKWRDLEARHEALRVAVMLTVSDPHLTWEQARQQLSNALNAGLSSKH